MKGYEKPEIKVTALEIVEDVLSTSGTDITTPESGNGGDGNIGGEVFD